MPTPNDQILDAPTRFKIGDRLRHCHASYLPIAIVKEITPRGFKYELERPLVISPRLGTQIGGESYDDSQWEIATEEPRSESDILDSEAVEEILARANAATEGPWESDNEKDSEHHYQYYMARSPERRVVFDTLNSAIGEIHEEADEDGVYRWDEVARRNVAFAAHAREDVPALCRTVKQLRAENEKLRNQIEGEQALDLVTERHLKPELHEAIKEATKKL